MTLLPGSEQLDKLKYWRTNMKKVSPKLLEEYKAAKVAFDRVERKIFKWVIKNYYPLVENAKTEVELDTILRDAGKELKEGFSLFMLFTEVKNRKNELNEKSICPISNSKNAKRKRV